MMRYLVTAAFHWSSGKTRQNGAVIKSHDALFIYCRLSLVFPEDETEWRCHQVALMRYSFIAASHSSSGKMRQNEQSSRH